LTLLDHWLLWHLAETGRLEILPTDSYFFVESSYDVGYSIIERKIGYRPAHGGYDIVLNQPAAVQLPEVVEQSLANACLLSREFWRTGIYCAPVAMSFKG